MSGAPLGLGHKRDQWRDQSSGVHQAHNSNDRHRAAPESTHPDAQRRPKGGESVPDRVIASMRANPPVRRGPSCTAGAAIRTLTDEDQRAIYGAADEIAARNSALTWKDLARLVHDETGLDVNWERMSRHCRRECACRR